MPDRLMIRSNWPPNLVVGAVAWDAASHGGTTGRDLLVTSVLLVAAFVSGSSGVSSLMPSRALVALVAWLILRGFVDGIELTTMRPPLLVVLVALTVGVCARFTPNQRMTLVRGLVVVTTAHAVVAILLTATNPPTTDILRDNVRVAGLVGNANALGVFLVAGICLTAGLLRSTPSSPLRTALLVQAIALLLTGSRLALLLALVVVCVQMLRHDRRQFAVTLVPAAALALVIILLRFDRGAPSRPQLWRAALAEIAHHPIAGRGPLPRVLLADPAGVSPTTHAHNEIAQVTLEYGVVGLLLFIVTVVVFVRSRSHRWSTDAWLWAAAGALAASGITDFSLRVTVIAVTFGALIGLIVERPPGLLAAARPTERRDVVGRAPSDVASAQQGVEQVRSGSPTPAGPGRLRSRQTDGIE